MNNKIEEKGDKATINHEKHDNMNMKNGNHSKDKKHEHMDHSKHEHMDRDMSMDHSSMHHGNHGNMDMGMDHSMHMGNMKQKFIISLILSIPVLFLSPFMGMKIPFQISFKGSSWIVLILATIIYFYGGAPFLKGAKMEFKNRKPAMMMLISMGISVAYFYSVFAFISNEILKNKVHIMDYFWELCTLIVIMLLGHIIEMNAIGKAGDALEKMAKLLPTTAHLIDKNGNIKDINLKDVKIGENLIVKTGENIPSDGVIVDGSSTINESMITGESKDIEKTIGSKVIGGSINGSGSLTIEVTATGETGYLSQVMNLVKNAQKEKSNIEVMSDVVAKWLFYVALFSGLAAFVVWLIITKDFNTALERMVTVFIIACPHALGLAIPLVIARTTSIAAKNGLLIKNRKAIELAKNIDDVFLDKTGTLTAGKFKINKIISYDTLTETEVLKIMGALEEQSSHPLGISIINELKSKNISFDKADMVKTISGVGIKGEINNKTYNIVNAAYLSKNNISYNEADFKELSTKGNSLSYLINDAKVIGLIAQGDEIKENSSELIEYLIGNKINPIMLTGDNKQTAEYIGNKLKIQKVYSELMPEDKEKIIKQYIDNKKIVMMVGDGINDAPSLARASVGVAIGAGTDIAIDSADIILVKDNPMDIKNLILLAKNSSRKMQQNLWWGAGYNIIAIPLAAGVLSPWGIILSPAVGAILMSISTVIVAINAMLLKIK